MTFTNFWIADIMSVVHVQQAAVLKYLHHQNMLFLLVRQKKLVHLFSYGGLVTTSVPSVSKVCMHSYTSRENWCVPGSCCGSLGSTNIEMFT